MRPTGLGAKFFDDHCLCGVKSIAPACLAGPRQVCLFNFDGANQAWRNQINSNAGGAQFLSQADGQVSQCTFGGIVLRRRFIRPS